MNNETIIEFGFRIIWRIMENAEDVIRLGLRIHAWYFHVLNYLEDGVEALESEFERSGFSVFSAVENNYY